MLYKKYVGYTINIRDTIGPRQHLLYKRTLPQRIAHTNTSKKNYTNPFHMNYSGTFKEPRLSFQITFSHSTRICMPTGIKKYDFYRKAIDGLQTKTTVGGLSKLRNHALLLVSLISAIIIAILVSMQTYSFFQTKTSTTLNVESQLDQTIPTLIDFSLFYMPCDCKFFHFLLTSL